MSGAWLKLLFGMVFLALGLFSLWLGKKFIQESVEKGEDTSGKMAALAFSSIPVAFVLIMGLFFVMTAFMPS